MDLFGLCLVSFFTFFFVFVFANIGGFHFSHVDYSTLTPMLLAVPSTIFIAASTFLVFRSTIFSSAIVLTCSLVSVPAGSLGVLPDPFSIPKVFLIMAETGAFLIYKVKDLSS